MFGLAIERTPPPDDGSEIGTAVISNVRVPLDGVTTLPDGTLVAQAPPTGGIVAVRNADGTVTVQAGAIPVGTAATVAHDTVTDLLNKLTSFSPLAALQSHPYLVVGGLAFIYLTFHKKGR